MNSNMVRVAVVQAGSIPFDVACHYSRPDVFTLSVNEAPMAAVVARNGPRNQ